MIGYLPKKKKRKGIASAGSRTRVYCLEGNYPNRWTTNACCLLRNNIINLTQQTSLPTAYRGPTCSKSQAVPVMRIMKCWSRGW